jgi:FixJ family two-component response regulator
VLTDVVMPGASGRVLIEELRMARPGVRTLYMSGYPTDSIVRYGVEEGDVPFLQKPFTMSTLARKVREALA